MVANPERRRQIADAGLRVLANDGARGLTHRAVDAEAGLPAGTCVNYYRSRDGLLGGLAERIFERLAPSDEVTTLPHGRTPNVELAVHYIQDIVARTTAAPELTVALFELRLESTRRPGLAETLQRTLSAAYRFDVDFNDAAGLPGGAHEIALMHYAIDGLLLDRLTASIGAGESTEQAAADLVRRILGGAA